MLQVRIIGTRLTDKRQSLGWFEEDGGLEYGGHALQLVAHNVRFSRSFSKRLAETKRHNDNAH
jgi:hypothetical protein